MIHYLRLDPRTREPKSLLRVVGSRVDVWWHGEWKVTPLLQAQLDGLGGDSDYYRIRPDMVEEWQEKILAIQTNSQ